MPWISAYTVVLVVALAAFGLLVGRIRRDSPSVITLNTVGVVLFVFGMAWAGTLG